MLVFGVGAIGTGGRYLAKRAVCVENIREQYEAQILFAQDQGWTFCPHNGPTPGYVRSYGQSKDECIYGHFKDSDYLPNTEVLLCPIQVSKLSKFVGTGLDNSTLSFFSSLAMINEISSMYANWNYQMDPDYDASRDYDYNTGAGLYGYVSMPYVWFANWQGGTTYFDFVSSDGYQVDETPWPRNLGDCTASAAMVTHNITRSSFLLADYSHGSKGFSYEGFSFQTYSDTPDTCVGYGDGHVEVHSKAQIRARARVGTGSGIMEYYY